jgi:hypothetical protein
LKFAEAGAHCYISAMSTNLIRLESDDPHAAGVLIRFDSGLPDKVVQWQTKPGELISPALDAAKQYTAAVIEDLVKENREADVRHTNWVSVAAAMHRIIRDFNGALHELQRERDAATLQ